MAAVTVRQNSTTVRKPLALSLLSARFAVGSWLAPRSTPALLRPSPAPAASTSRLPE